MIVVEAVVVVVGIAISGKNLQLSLSPLNRMSSTAAKPSTLLPLSTIISTWNWKTTFKAKTLIYLNHKM